MDILKILIGLLFVSEVLWGSLVKDAEASKEREEQILKICLFLTLVYHSNVITREEAQ